MSGWNAPAIEDIVRLLLARVGLSFSPHREEEVENVIRQSMVKAGAPDLESFHRLLRSGRVPLDDLITGLTVRETYFMREPAQFAWVREVIVPRLEALREPDHMFRAWSAGCASGEEAYSLAMVLEELGWGARSHVLGTDVSKSALAIARKAEYRPWSLRAIDAEQTAQYFEPVSDRWRVIDRIRDRVTFEFHNLVTDPYPALATGTWGLDLIFCRNVLMYFERPTSERIAHRLLDCLADGGWLILGPSDPSPSVFPPFEAVVTDKGTFYRRRDATAVSGTVPSYVPGPAVDSTRAPPPPGPIAAAAQAVIGATALEGGARGPAQPPGAGVETNPAGPDVSARMLENAREAYARGDYAGVVARASELARDADAYALVVRAAANQLGAAEAEHLANDATSRHPLSSELHFLRAVLLMELRRDEAAIVEMQRTLFLDRSLAVAQFILGMLFKRQGREDAARKAFRNARDLSRKRPPDEVLPLGDGERAGGLVQAATTELELLAESKGVAR